MSERVLAVDVGNTSITLGVFEGETLVQHWKIKTVRDQFPDDYATHLYSLFAMAQLPKPTAAVVASVVPPLGKTLVQALHSWDVDAVELESQNLGLTFELSDPRAVGVDRAVNAVAASEYLGDRECVLVIDFGTATTLDAIARPNRFLGGVIAPGPMTMANALFSATAKLPQVPFIAPQQALGKNTQHALQSGLVLGYADLIDGLVRRLKQELPDTFVVATGGWFTILQDVCSTVDHYDEHLTLKGLFQAWTSERHAATLKTDV
ncbi:MAG: type III pantothenate kinase [Deinococcaceae bacterium]